LYRTPHLTTISFAVGVLLFFLPFMEVKCNGTTLAQMTGTDMVIGSEPKMGSDFERMAKGLDKKTGDQNTTVTKSEKKGKTYVLAIVALALGIGGAIVSLVKKGGYNKVEIVCGAIGALALIILMFQVKADVNDQMKSSSGKETDSFSGMMSLSVDFTIWFFLCVISYLVAAFFSYKQKELVEEGVLPSVKAPQLSVQNPGDQSDFPPAATGEKDLG
jgi:hypothetical protein